MSSRRSARSKKKTREMVVPEMGTAPSPMPSLTGSSVEQIQELIDLLRRNSLTELEFERQGIRIRVRHEVGSKSVMASVQEPVAPLPETLARAPLATGPLPEDTAGLVTVTSPIVGTFYRSPSPDADPYAEEGEYVRKGQVLCIVEAMKLMNEIESEVNGRIVKIVVENMKSVEYGQALFLIDPKATP